MSKIYGLTSGDHDVGIPDGEFSIDLGIELDPVKDVMDRDRIKKELTEYMRELHDSSNADSWFDDECPDCKHLATNKCHNKNCISYQR